jgi:hypothetical protein
MCGNKVRFLEEEQIPDKIMNKIEDIKDSLFGFWIGMRCDSCGENYLSFIEFEQKEENKSPKQREKIEENILLALNEHNN